MWKQELTPCGRTYPHLPDGIFGRIDDAFTIRGENIYPNEIDTALNQMDDYGGEHRILISRESEMDELLVQVEILKTTCTSGLKSINHFKNQISDTLHRILGIRTRVEVVPENSLARSDFKARRVIDDRQIFQEFNAKLEKDL